MIIEITTYKLAEGVTHEDFMKASDEFNKNYCARCKGLIRRHVLKTEDGYSDIILWETKEDVERVQKTFLEDSDALAFAKHGDPQSLTMHNYEVLDTFEATK
jgi:hypothetical protein